MTAVFNRIQLFANNIEWVVLLMVFALILRLPSLIEPAWYLDETIYLAIGQEIRSGDLLYQDITDFPNKPPLIYYLASIVQTVPVFRLLLLFWHLPAIAAFFYLTKQFFKNENISFFATLMFVYLTNTPLLEGNIPNAEMFFLTPVLLGFLLITKYMVTSSPTRQWQLFLGGISLGVGALFKFHVVFDVLAIVTAIMCLSKLSLSKKFRMIAVVTAGVVLPVFGSILLLLGAGLPARQLIDAVLPTTSYVDSGVFVFWKSLPVRFVIAGLLISGAIVIRKKLSIATLVIVFWFIFDLFAVLLSGRPYTHYLLQVIPAAILLVAILVSKTNKTEKKVTVLGVWLFFAVYFLFHFTTWSVKDYYKNSLEYVLGIRPYQEYLAWFDLRMPRNHLASELIKANSDPLGELFVWGIEPDLYVLTHKTTPAKVVTSFHVQDLNLYEETLQSLMNNPPEVIVIDEQESRTIPGFDQWLGANYLLISTVTDSRGRTGALQVYRNAPEIILGGRL